MTKRLSIGAGVLAVILLGISVVMFRTNIAKADGMEQIQSVLSPIVSIVIQRADGTSETMNGNLTEQNQQPPTFGAVAVLNSPLEVNGTTEYRSSIPFNQGTSTLVDFLTPPATTTAAEGNITVQFRSWALHAQLFQIANGATYGATTTDLGSITIPSGGLGLGIASTTDKVFGPSTHLVLKLATSTATISTGYAPKGSMMVFLKAL